MLTECVYQMSKPTQMRAGRDPPLSPDDAEGVIRSLKFSYQSDTEAVIDMYRRGFVAAFAGYNGVYTSGGAGVMWAGLKWNDEEGRRLAKAIQFAEEHCDVVTPPVRPPAHTPPPPLLTCSPFGGRARLRTRVAGWWVWHGDRCGCASRAMPSRRTWRRSSRSRVRRTSSAT